LYKVQGCEIASKQSQGVESPDPFALADHLKRMKLKENGDQSLEMYEIDWRTTITIVDDGANQTRASSKPTADVEADKRVRRVASSVSPAE